jgi:hypothetical protein
VTLLYVCHQVDVTEPQARSRKVEDDVDHPRAAVAAPEVENMMSIYNSLFFRIVVRRTTSGSTPFQWEMYKDDSVVPLRISAERFACMEAAHGAGQAALTTMLQQKQAATKNPSRGTRSYVRATPAAAAPVANAW